MGKDGPMSGVPGRGRIEVSGEDVARTVLGSAVGRLVANDPVARRGLDPEGVHQLRVAARHLRAELRLLTPVLKDKAIEPVRADLRWLGQSLGDVRDVDVRFARLSALLDDQVGADAVAAALEDLEHRERSLATTTAREALESKRYRSLVGTLVAMVLDPPVTRLAAVPARGILTPGLRAEATRLEEAVEGLGPQPSASALHQVRIAAKRLRYGAEVAALYAGEPATEVADQLAVIQDLLGDGRDAAFAIELLRGLGHDATTPFAPTSDEGRVVESLIEAEQSLIAEAARVWPAAYASVRHGLAALDWLPERSTGPGT